MISKADLETQITVHLIESWKIEGLDWYKEEGSEYRDQMEDATKAFLALDAPTVKDMCNLVDAIEPGAKLRDQPGMDVRVGEHVPLMGGPDVVERLATMLRFVNDGEHSWTPFVSHQIYETLHPFMDGNGRSGRLLWLWQMLRGGWDCEISFLEWWYRASLAEGR